MGWFRLEAPFADRGLGVRPITETARNCKPILNSSLHLRVLCAYVVNPLLRFLLPFRALPKTGCEIAASASNSASHERRDFNRLRPEVGGGKMVPGLAGTEVFPGEHRIAKVAVRHCDPTTERDGCADDGACSEHDDPGYPCKTGPRAGERSPLAPWNGSRRHCDAECGRKKTQSRENLQA